MRHASRWLGSISLALFFFGCGIGEESPDPTEGTGVPHNWTMSASADRTSLAMKQGQTDTVLITATRGGGFI